MSIELIDELSALRNSRTWILRRVDRMEFIDLTTVHRTIVFTLDPSRLVEALPRPRPQWFPLGLFRRDAARAGLRLVDGHRNTVAPLSRAASDERIKSALASRLRALGTHDRYCAVEPLLSVIERHRPGSCELLDDKCRFDGYADLAAEKWGCPAVAQLLVRLQGAKTEKNTDQVAELVRLLFDWQNNFVLFVPFQSGRAPETLECSYDEDLQLFQPPWERRRNVRVPKNDLRKPRPVRQVLARALPNRRTSSTTPKPDDQGPEVANIERAERAHIGRLPFGDALDELRPHNRVLRWFPTRRTLLTRKLARQGWRLAWHVAWVQSSGSDVAFNVVEVKVPPELAVVRMRALEVTLVRDDAEKLERAVRVAAAPYSTSAASLVLPSPTDNQGAPSAPLAGLFVSLLVGQRKRGSWIAGGLVGLITGVVLLVAATQALRPLVLQATTAVTVLLLAPTLVIALLSVRAASEIAAELTQNLRFMFVLFGMLTVACAVSLAVQSQRSPSVLHRLLVSEDPVVSVVTLRGWWIGFSIALISLGLILLYSSRRIHQQLGYHDPYPTEPQRLKSGDKRLRDTRMPHAPRIRIPPPDRWVQSGEGDRVPWGWLYVEPDSSFYKEGQRRDGHWSRAPSNSPDADTRREEDKRYWRNVDPSLNYCERVALVKWREALFPTTPTNHRCRDR